MARLKKSFDSAHLTLGCPVYACDFDPQDPNKLIVGGGGGVRAGDVPNRIVGRAAATL